MKYAIGALLCAALLAGSAAPSHAQSLYKEESFKPLTADHRARAVGDAITILIQEVATASSTANTNAGRGAGLSGRVETPAINKGFGVQTGNQFDAKGQTQRTGRLLAQMTVTVIDVAANGDLTVSGEQLLEINSEAQRIRVDGRVRPTDIGEGNTVPSYKVADARIAYVGSGDLSDKQRPGWWQRLFTWFGL